MNETFYHWLLRFSKEEVKQMITELMEWDKSFFPYSYCFIADTDDAKTLLYAMQNKHHW